MTKEEWPCALRDVHLMGGAYAINDPSKQDKVFIFPNTLDQKQVVLTIPTYSKIFYALEKHNLKPIIGVDFFTNNEALEGIQPPQWRSNTSYHKKRWSHTEADRKWGQISNHAYTEKNGHLWDLSKRIQNQIFTINNTFRSLSFAYRNQLESKVKDGFKPGGRFENGYTSYIYDEFQHFLFDACMLRDYISEFVFHYVVPPSIKQSAHMTTTSKVYTSFFKNREVTNPYDIYFKEACSSTGWLNKLGCYRDLVMHACPASMPNQRAWIRCEMLEVLDDKQIPIIVAPIPSDPLSIKKERNNFKYFEDFESQAKEFFGKSNSKAESIDLLEYSYTIMENFSTLLWLTSEQSPLEGRMMIFDKNNIIGDIKTTYI